MGGNAVIGILRALLTLDSAQFESGIRQSSKSLNLFIRDTKNVGQQLTTLGSSMTKALTLPILGLGVGVGKAAIDFESSFAGIRKTVNATEQQFNALSLGMRNLSKTIPINVNELNKIGEAAGQLGIKTENILGFTEVMAELGVTTDLSSEQAATSLAQLANITGMAQTDFDRLGSSIVALGNGSKTAESKIVDFGLRIAGAGKLAGLSEADILGIGAAMSSVGVEAERGGTAVQTVLQGMVKATVQGGASLGLFAQTAEMSASDFKVAFEHDAAGVFTKFVEGLGKQGKSAIATLDDLGLGDKRLLGSFLALAGAGGDLRREIGLSNIAWRENTALSKEAEQRFKTTASQLTLLWNRIKDVGVTIGNALLPLINSTIKAFDEFIPTLESAAKLFADLPTPVQAAAVGIGLMAAAAGPALMLIGQMALGASALAKAFTTNGAATKALTFLLGEGGLGGAASVLGRVLTGLVSPLKLIGVPFLALDGAIRLLTGNSSSLTSVLKDIGTVVTSLCLPAIASFLKAAQAIAHAVGVEVVGALRGVLKTLRETIPGLDFLINTFNRAKVITKEGVGFWHDWAEEVRKNSDAAAKAAAESSTVMGDGIAGIKTYTDSGVASLSAWSDAAKEAAKSNAELEASLAAAQAHHVAWNVVVDEFGTKALTAAHNADVYGQQLGTLTANLLRYTQLQKAAEMEHATGAVPAFQADTSKFDDLSYWGEYWKARETLERGALERSASARMEFLKREIDAGRQGAYAQEEIEKLKVTLTIDGENRRFEEETRFLDKTTGLFAILAQNHDEAVKQMVADYEAGATERLAIEAGFRGDMGKIGDPNVVGGSGMPGVWSKLLGGGKDIAGSLNGIFQSAFEGGGGAMGAVKSFATNAVATLSNMIPVVGPIVSQFSGAIVAGFSKLFGGIGGEERKVNDLRDKFIESAGGIEELNKKAVEAGTSLDRLLAAKKVTTFDAAVKALNGSLEQHQQQVEDAAEFSDTLSTSLDAVASSGHLASKELLGMVEQLDAAGQASAELDKFKLSGLKTAAEGLNAGLTSLSVTTQTEATGVGAAIAGVFSGLQQHGYSAAAALEALQPAIAGLSADLEHTGLTGGPAFDQIARMATLAADSIAGPAITSVSGLGQALVGLQNSGMLTEEMFLGLSGMIGTTYDTLISRGASGDEALRLMQPSLQTIYELQQDFGYSVDSSTQLLLDQAEASNLVGETHRSASDKMAKGVERLVELMSAFLKQMGVEVPEAAEKAAGTMGDVEGSAAGVTGEVERIHLAIQKATGEAEGLNTELAKPINKTVNIRTTTTTADGASGQAGDQGVIDWGGYDPSRGADSEYKYQWLGTVNQAIADGITTQADADAFIGATGDWERYLRILDERRQHPEIFNPDAVPSHHMGGFITAHAGMYLSPRLKSGEVLIKALTGESVLNRPATAMLGEAGVNALNAGDWDAMFSGMGDLSAPSMGSMFGESERAGGDRFVGADNSGMEKRLDALSSQLVAMDAQHRRAQQRMITDIVNTVLTRVA